MFIVEHLKINMKHNSYIYLTHILHFKFAPNIPVHTKLSILYTVFVLFCTLSILYIIICIICVLSCHIHSVALWSFYHQNKFLVCVNIPGNKADSDIKTYWKTLREPAEN